MGLLKWAFKAGRKGGNVVAKQYKKSKLKQQMPERVRRRRR